MRITTPALVARTVLLTTALTSLAGTAALAQTGVTHLPSGACTPLQGMSIAASAIGLETSGALVQTAVAVAASDKDNANGDFCKVTGIVKPKNPTSPNLEFQVNLPLAWNRRVLQMGGGGYNGTLVTALGGFTLQPATVDNPLKQGFVTLGTDGGHKAAAGFDGRFAMDDEALLNFGKASVKKGHDVAVAIIKKAYGRAPERFYFIGGSWGTRSAGRRHALPARLRRRGGALSAGVTLLHLGSLNVGRRCERRCRVKEPR
jgi:feruloyl esterase